MHVLGQRRDASPLVARQPAIQRIGIAGLEDAAAGHGVWGLASGDAQQGSTPLPELGAWVVVAMLDQGSLFLLGQRQRASFHHGWGSFLLHPPITDLQNQK